MNKITATDVKPCRKKCGFTSAFHIPDTLANEKSLVVTVKCEHLTSANEVQHGGIVEYGI